MSKEKNENHKKLLLLITVVAALLVAGIAAAALSLSKGPESKEEQQAANITTAQEKTTAKKEDVPSSPTPHPTIEPTPTPTPEPIVYDGIDMESTLPGIDWILTFNGIIDEPKLVVFNDDTNKKVIVENGQEVEFSRSDKLGIYIPEGKGYIDSPDLDVFNRSCSYNISYLETISGKYNNVRSAVTKNVVVFNDEEITLTATLIFTD